MSLTLALLLAQGAPWLESPIPDGRARIVFYRNGAFYFGGRGCSAYADLASEARRVAALGRSEYALLDVDPGEVRLSGSKTMKQPISLELAAGETRYVRCEVAGMMGSSRLVHSDALEFARYRSALDKAD